MRFTDALTRTSGADVGGLAVQRATTTVTLAVAVYRVYGLCQVVEATVIGDPRFQPSLALVALTGAVIVEGLVFLAISGRLRRLPTTLVSIDTAFQIPALVLGAMLIPPEYRHTWMYYLYPYTMISCVAIGVTYRRLGTVLAVTGLLAGSYLATATAWHHDPWWNAAPNAISYFTSTTVGWVVARHLRRNAQELDRSRDLAVAQADLLARAHERERHARLLHDRVLQTLEALARDGVLVDQTVRRRVAAEATWLRSLVEQVDTEPDDLVTGLRRLAQQQALAGLTVELNTADLADARVRPAIGPDVAAALVDAAYEALNNVGKHSGVDSAVLRVAVSGDSLVLTVLDHGCGFDPATTCPGLGLAQSIGGRLREVGGRSRVDSSPGAGTYVELTVSLPGGR